MKVIQAHYVFGYGLVKIIKYKLSKIKNKKYHNYSAFNSLYLYVIYLITYYWIVYEELVAVKSYYDAYLSINIYAIDMLWQYI